jgi:hypothetical protein
MVIAGKGLFHVLYVPYHQEGSWWWGIMRDPGMRSTLACKANAMGLTLVVSSVMVSVPPFHLDGKEAAAAHGAAFTQAPVILRNEQELVKGDSCRALELL